MSPNNYAKLGIETKREDREKGCVSDGRCENGLNMAMHSILLFYFVFVFSQRQESGSGGKLSTERLTEAGGRKLFSDIKVRPYGNDVILTRM